MDEEHLTHEDKFVLGNGTPMNIRLHVAQLRAEYNDLRTTARAHEVIIETAHEALTAAGHTAEVDGYIPGAINELAGERDEWQGLARTLELNLSATNDEVERLDGENVRLRKVLEMFADPHAWRIGKEWLGEAYAPELIAAKALRGDA
jgi:hypothetical protein